ncbi:AAA family ATPase [Rothia koreensis]|uniref:AAA family ATPase n=1 Tax=Rothia koreensis TaxID=592378 RepID=UPI003F272C0C
MKRYDEARTELRVTYAHMIQPHRQRWLWAHDQVGVIPLGTGTIAAGIGGEGKSTFMLDLAAQLTNGTLPGDLYGSRENVIIFGPEDDWPTVMVPRLMAAGADLSRVAQVQAATITESFTSERELIFPVDRGLLREAVKETGARMVIIDPAPNLMDGDMNKVQDVRRSYGPLMALAQEHDLAIILINHFGKGAGNVGAKLSGSHAWRDLTRSYLAFASDPDTGERILTQDKNNYGTGRGSWKFTLESVDVPTEDGNTNVGKVRFLGASEVTVGELINREYGEDSAEDRNELDNWLIEILTEAGGSMSVKEIKTSAASSGYEFKTLQNRRPKIRNPKVTTGRNGFGKGSIPFWQIEEESSIDPGQNTIDPIDPDPESARTYDGTYEESSVSSIDPDQMIIDPVRSEARTYRDLCAETGTYEPELCTKMDCTRHAATGHEWCQHHIDLRQRRFDVEAKRQGDAA